MEDVKLELLRRRETLLAIAEHEKLVTAVASAVALSVIAAAMLFLWSDWIVGMAGLASGWFMARHLRARRLARSTAKSIARLRAI